MDDSVYMATYIFSLVFRPSWTMDEQRLVLVYDLLTIGSPGLEEGGVAVTLIEQVHK